MVGKTLLGSGHGALSLFDHALDHVASDVASLTGGHIAVVPLFEVNAQLVGDFKLHVIEGLLGFGNHGTVGVAGVALTLIHIRSPLQNDCA